MSDISEVMGGNFDTNSVPPAEAFEVLPAGWYPVKIDNAEVKDTKRNDGKILSLEMTVIGDKFSGRKLWPRINLQNPSQKATEIGMRELAGLGLACGLATISDSSEFIDKDLEVKVKVRAEEGREPDNQIVAYRTLANASVPADPAPKQEKKPAATPSPSSKPAESAKPAFKRPWEK